MVGLPFGGSKRHEFRLVRIGRLWRGVKYLMIYFGALQKRVYDILCQKKLTFKQCEVI
jgi:hypothetical protein